MANQTEQFVDFLVFLYSKTALGILNSIASPPQAPYRARSGEIDLVHKQ
jgi:hypothetical protein